MDLNVFNEKKEGNLKIKEKFWFQKKDKCCWLVKLADKSMIIELRDAFLWLNGRCKLSRKTWKKYCCSK